MKDKMFNFFKLTLILSGILLLSNSCTKEKENYWSVNDFTVQQKEWLWEKSDNSYFFEFTNYNELSASVANNGSVSATVLIDGTYRPLPYTTYFINEKGQYCAETINFEYGIKYIRFNISSLDLFDNTPVSFQPISHRFKVTLIAK